MGDFFRNIIDCAGLGCTLGGAVGTVAGVNPVSISVDAAVGTLIGAGVGVLINVAQGIESLADGQPRNGAS